MEERALIEDGNVEEVNIDDSDSDSSDESPQLPSKKRKPNFQIAEDLAKEEEDFEDQQIYDPVILSSRKKKIICKSGEKVAVSSKKNS